MSRHTFPRGGPPFGACPDFWQGRQCTAGDCPFPHVHSWEALSEGQTLPNDSICWHYWHTGECPYGDSCNFSHVDPPHRPCRSAVRRAEPDADSGRRTRRYKDTVSPAYDPMYVAIEQQVRARRAAEYRELVELAARARPVAEMQIREHWARSQELLYALLTGQRPEGPVVCNTFGTQPMRQSSPVDNRPSGPSIRSTEPITRLDRRTLDTDRPLIHFAFSEIRSTISPSPAGCTVCNQYFRDTERVVVVNPCGHTFHRECVQRILDAGGYDCCPGPGCSVRIAR